jgi:OmpA family
MKAAQTVLTLMLAASASALFGCGRSDSSSSAPSAPSRAVTVAHSAANAPKRGAACSFITALEMASILGAPIGTPVDENSPGEASCSYPPGEAASYAQAEIAIEWDHGIADSLEHKLADVFGDTEAGGAVAHKVALGDRASYSEGVLSIQTGKTQVTITLPMGQNSEAQAGAIGKKLLARMGVPVEPVPAPATAAAKGGKFPDPLALREDCPAAPADTADPEAALVPLKAGLTLSHTWIGGPGDYEHECLVQVVAVTATYVDVTQSCPVGPDHHNDTNKRRLCRKDLRDSYFYHPETSSDLPAVISAATMFSLSTHSLQELKATTATRLRYIQVSSSWRTNPRPLRFDTDGTLRAFDGDHEAYPVIINSRMVTVPVIVGIANGDNRDATTVKVLDDVRFPLVLDYHTPLDGFRIRYTKISYPTSGALEKQLEVDKHVDVYGIFFDFASDRLRGESTPVLAEIAGVMTKNSTWTLHIAGHTDNVGSDASNLDLSRRRAQAVKTALVKQFGIAETRMTTGGYGASQPQAGNDTPEGRARNRRVELSRQ